MRVLMLASYFPKPANPIMGNWALAQAQALQACGAEIEVVSGTSWVPALGAARSGGTAAYALCPPSHDWQGLTVHYPRWLFYSFRQLYHSLASNPAPQIRLAWWSIRRAVLSHVDRFQPDIIYCHHTQINGYIARQIQRLRNIPYVVTDHDFGELDACLDFPRRRLFLADTAGHASCLVSVARRMERIVNQAFPDARTRTIHNGTVTPPDIIFSTPRPEALRGALVVFSACAFYERKGIPLLIRAFHQVAERYPSAVLRIAGDGAERLNIEAAIREGQLADRVTLLGKIPHAQVLQEMAWCNLFALPGWDEPFATAYSEALSAGCPIIYGADGGITDVVTSGQHGIPVQPQDQSSLVHALDTLLGNSELRGVMSRNARSLYRYSLKWEHNARRMLALFEECQEVWRKHV